MQTTHIDNTQKQTAETRPNGIKKILLIGQKRQIGLSAALGGERYDVIHCDSIQQAWSFVYPHRPDLIVINLIISTAKIYATFRNATPWQKASPSF